LGYSIEMLIFLAVLLAIGQTAPPIPGKARNGPGSTGQSVSNKSSDDQKPPAKPLSSVNPITANPQQKPSNAPQPENEPQPVRITEFPAVPISRDWADWVLWIFNGLLVIAGFLGIGVAYKTLKVLARQTTSIHHQAVQVRKQSHFMRRQMDLAIQKERPRIAVELGQVKFTRDGTQVACTIDFWCPSPAFIVDTSVEAFTKAALIVKPVSFPIEMSKQAVRSEKIQSLISVCAGNRPEIVDPKDVRSKTKVIHVRGFIKYRGIHLQETDPPYVTSFAFDWIPVEYHPVPGSGYWQEDGENKTT
jgi:hypothetical protein